MSDQMEDRIAIVGFAGRFPDAPDTDAFWENLRNGVESIHDFSEAELSALGIPEAVYKDPNFVPRATRLPDFDRFDAAFFGFTPREASVMDPQARIFLETTKAALDHAGYDPARYEAPISLFAGSNPNDYWFLLGMGDLSDPAGAWDRLIGNDKDFLATRASHRLDLRGPAMTLQTACSTSLVAVHLACQSLLAYESTIALAGGVSVNLRQRGGYMYQPGMILSPDGHCRAFDADAGGTVLGQAAGVVVLKRLEDAVADGDTIHAVILATAINNDGSNKVSYTAPNEDGQAEVIATAHRLAGIDPSTISYVEAHGTGTSLGDPVEIAALTRAFASKTDRTGFCAIGSVKTNVGHTDAAAGVTGLIKTVLALEHRELPPSLNFSAPNPGIDFENSPFYVNSELRHWESDGPRRAGISSFGVGGTNAHAILEEAPPAPAGAPETGPQLLVISARTESALATQAGDLADYLDGTPDLADTAFTLQTGRTEYEHRTYVVADSAAAAADQLRQGHLPAAPAAEAARDLAFMFSGQGAQYPGMTRDLYDAEPVFRDEVDRCAEILEPFIDADIRRFLYPADGQSDPAAEALRQTAITQPALFTVEWALTRLLASWGVTPQAVVGHSIGEYVAATVAGVFTLESGLRLVARRGALMQSLPPGAMLAVQAPADELIPHLSDGVELAARNSSRLSVVTGEAAAIEAFASRLDAQDMSVQTLHTSHAFHSHMMEPILDEFAEEVRRANPQPPQLPMLSNVTGGFLADEDAANPEFWAGQIRRPVLFADNVSALVGAGRWAFLEVGPGRALATFVRQHDAVETDAAVVTATRHPREERSDRVVLLEALGRLWQAGITPEWTSVHGSGRRRLPLPGYPFERERFWAPAVEHVAALGNPAVEAPVPLEPEPAGAGEVDDRLPLGEWSFVPTWRIAPPAAASPADIALVFGGGRLGRAVIEQLEGQGMRVIAVHRGDRFERSGWSEFTMSPSDDDHYEWLMTALAGEGLLPDIVLHLWATETTGPFGSVEEVRERFDSGVNSFIAIARALGRQSATHGCRLEAVTLNAHRVTGDEVVNPEQAAMLGPAKVVPLEYGNLRCRVIDVDSVEPTDQLLAQLVGEVLSEPVDLTAALRDGGRWVPDLEPHPVNGEPPVPLTHGGTYLLVGGLGGVGLSIGRFLAEEYGARLGLVARSSLDRSAAADDAELAARIAAFEALESAADRVVVVEADATDEGQMRAAVATIEEQLGPIDGVVFTAAVVDDAGTIHTRLRSEQDRVVASKLYGPVVLDRIFEGRQLDFIMLSSSNASAMYHNRFGQVGYMTANSFAEAFPYAAHRADARYFTVAWEDWRDYGITVRATQQFAERYDYGAVELMDEDLAMSWQEGVEVFSKLLADGEGLYYLSSTDLRMRVAADADKASPFLEGVLESDPAGSAPVAAGTSVQDQVIELWKELLGYDDVSETDDFFALGGDSLLVARMADKLSRATGAQVPINLIFEAPTAGGLAQRIQELLPEDAPSSQSPAGGPSIVEGAL